VRLLLVSDLHYTLRQLDWVADRATTFDAVVIAGDLLDISSVVPVEAQIALVEQFLARLGQQTLVIVGSGNHDLDGPDAQGEQAAGWLSQLEMPGVEVDGATVELGDSLVTVCPWWDGPLGRSRVVEQLARDAARGVRPWIWVYHWPPTGSPTAWTGRSSYGDADLLAWISEHQPDLVLAGHVHQSPFADGGSWSDRIGRTLVLNAGRQIGPEPTHIVIDLEAGVARWRSLEGEAEVSLDVPSPAAQ
jgi:Icc-related predicted phosphoesterase